MIPGHADARRDRGARRGIVDPADDFVNVVLGDQALLLDRAHHGDELPALKPD